MPLSGRTRALGVAAFLLVAAPVFGAGSAIAAILAFRVTPTHFSPNGDGVQDRTLFAWTRTVFVKRPRGDHH